MSPLASATTKSPNHVLRTDASEAECTIGSALSAWIIIMLTNLWPVRHRRNRSSKMQEATRRRTNVVGRCRIHYSHLHNQDNVSHKCFIWIVAWLSLFAILTQAQINGGSNRYSAPSQKQQPTSPNTSTQSTSAPFSGTSPLTLTALHRIPLGAISNSGRDKWYKRQR